MGIIIKNGQAEAKIRRLAKRTGETLTAAVERAVDERLSRLGTPKRKGRVNREALARNLAYFRSLPKINEGLTDEEIIGYDENGVPV
ncbi:MAG: type II toxin-antitoxin system VapB family antitoxin [Xanthobacteraceae bacterium]